MKLKFLSAIARISIITAIITTNIGVSSTAQTQKDIQLSSSLNRNSNKEYGNKQNNLSLVGDWKSVVYKRGQEVHLFTRLKSDGTHNTAATYPQIGSKRLLAQGNWRYSGNTLNKTNHTKNGTSTERTRIKWISKDKFTSTDNEGFQITYRRDIDDGGYFRHNRKRCIHIQNEFSYQACVQVGLQGDIDNS